MEPIPCGEIIAGDGLFGLLDLKVDRSGVQFQLEVAASGQRAEFDVVRAGIRAGVRQCTGI